MEKTKNTTALPLKIDRTKLKTVDNYAKMFGMSRPTVYRKMGDGVLTKVLIDGVTFVLIEPEKPNK